MPNVEQALNRLAKWRTIFAGWQLGTRMKGDPECDAVRNHREVTIFLRAEVTALVALLIKKGVFTEQEWTEQVIEECEYLNEKYEEQFPGCKATDIGMQMDIRAVEMMKNWRP